MGASAYIWFIYLTRHCVLRYHRWRHNASKYDQFKIEHTVCSTQSIVPALTGVDMGLLIQQ